MLSNNQEEIAQYKAALTRLQEQIAFIQEHFRPLVGGELYLNGEEVCELLHIGKRTISRNLGCRKRVHLFVSEQLPSQYP